MIDSSSGDEVESAFMGYITQYGKSYGTVAEYTHRLEQFARNHKTILEHNATESSYELGYNTMSDWTQEEYKSRLTNKTMPEEDKVYVQHDTNAVANSVDWR